MPAHSRILADNFVDASFGLVNTTSPLRHDGEVRWSATPLGSMCTTWTTSAFLHLADGAPRFSGAASGSGDLLTWGTLVDRSRWMKLWVACFD